MLRLLRLVLLLPVALLLLLARALLRLFGWSGMLAPDAQGRQPPVGDVGIGLRLDGWVARGSRTIHLVHKASSADVSVTGWPGDPDATPEAAAELSAKGRARVLEQVRKESSSLSEPSVEQLESGLRLTSLRATTAVGAVHLWLLEGRAGMLLLRAAEAHASAAAQLARSAAPYALPDFVTRSLRRKVEAERAETVRKVVSQAATEEVLGLNALEPSAATAALRLVNDELRGEVPDAAWVEVAPGLGLVAVSQGSERLLLRQVPEPELTALGFSFDQWRKLALARLPKPKLKVEAELAVPAHPEPNVSLALFRDDVQQELCARFGPRWLVAVPSHGFFVATRDSEDAAQALRRKVRQLGDAGLVDLSTELYRVQAGGWFRVPA